MTSQIWSRRDCQSRLKLPMTAITAASRDTERSSRTISPDVATMANYTYSLNQRNRYGIMTRQVGEKTENCTSRPESIMTEPSDLIIFPPLLSTTRASTGLLPSLILCRMPTKVLSAVSPTNMLPATFSSLTWVTTARRISP